MVHTCRMDPAIAKLAPTTWPSIPDQLLALRALGRPPEALTRSPRPPSGESGSFSGLAASRGEGTTLYAIGVVTETGEHVENIAGVLGSVTVKIRRALTAYLRFKRDNRQEF